MSRIVPVTPASIRTMYNCVACGKVIYAPAYGMELPENYPQAYADLDGEPYRAYYCEDDAETLKATGQ